jgi:hypothetical protein
VTIRFRRKNSDAEDWSSGIIVIMPGYSDINEKYHNNPVSATSSYNKDYVLTSYPHCPIDSWDYDDDNHGLLNEIPEEFIDL